MTTAVEYRQYAKECLESAREATSDPIRKQFLDMAKLWMLAADKLDPGHLLQVDDQHVPNGKNPPLHMGGLSNEPC
jgi:hypothetical protein